MEKPKKAKKSYVSEACASVGVSDTVFYTARKKFNNGEDLTKNELDVLSLYTELKEDGKKKLEKLRGAKI